MRYNEIENLGGGWPKMNDEVRSKDGQMKGKVVGFANVGNGVLVQWTHTTKIKVVARRDLKPA